MGKIIKQRRRTRTVKTAIRKRRQQRGEGLDVQKWLARTGIEFHWPKHQYLGPGTHLEKRLKRGDPGINRLDKIAKQHDIDYASAKNLKSKHAADCLPGTKSLPEHIVSKIMHTKLKLNV